MGTLAIPVLSGSSGLQTIRRNSTGELAKPGSVLCRSARLLLVVGKDTMDPNWQGALTARRAQLSTKQATPPASATSKK